MSPGLRNAGVMIFRDLCLYAGRRTADTVSMNGLGVGASVGLGAIIGLSLVSPGGALIEYVATFGFYGFLTGLLFELYRFALTWKHPFR